MTVLFVCLAAIIWMQLQLRRLQISLLNSLLNTQAYLQADIARLRRDLAAKDRVAP